ncbi:MAG: PA14 domain-containing protein, partial [Victivallales bacterium]|nr:PA14 domain-containing protein [Victivallales bacterium]
MRIKSFSAVLLTFAIAVQIFADDPDFTPVKIRPVRATYTKITINWQRGSSATQAVYYKILRNDNQVGTSTETQYTDTGLQTGTEYTYKVIAVSASEENSPPSAELALKTIKSVTFDNSGEVEQVVDQLHDTATTTTALLLLTAVKGGLEALLNTNISFTCLDADILNTYVSEELTYVQELVPELTDAEYLAARTELDNILNEGFAGNSFEHVYIHSKLSELAEKHWLSGHKEAAKALYNFSLNYLDNQESSVFNVLARLARFEVEAITDQSSDAEIAAALNAQYVQYNRFFDFFPNSTALQALYARRMATSDYFKYFPRLLTYSTYDQGVFANARQAAQAALNLAVDDVNIQKIFEKIDAWELINQNMTFVDSLGNPVTAALTVKNITADTGKKYYIYNQAAFVDEREFIVEDGAEIIPAYKGHIYELSLAFNVAGGNPLKLTLTGVPAEPGKVITFNNSPDPVETDGEPGISRTAFIIDHPTMPYNLAGAPAIDVFNLSWDWADSAGFTATHFKVFRGETEIADVTGHQADNIPLTSPDGVSTYTVIAYDAADNASPASRALLVVPGDQTPYADYFAWMQSYFGEQAMYSCDDPDGDGVSNYQEFLNGTDPTRIPGPTVYLQQKTYTKITLKWDTMFTGKTGVGYKIFRDNVEVGTSLTTSFTDTGLTPGMTFSYKVSAFAQDGTESERGDVLAVKTMAPGITSYAAELQQIVDRFNPSDAVQYTGATLITAVKSGLEALIGTNISFTVVDSSILETFVDEELNLIKEVSPSLTAAERLTAQTELSDILNNSFGGNSFEHVYMNSKLSELAEKHWLAGHKTAAKELYECALSFLKDHETSVFNVLARLAYFELQEITDTSTVAEIVTALNNCRDAHLRFFSYFEDSTSLQAVYAYKIPAIKYFAKFPQLLTYDDYHQDVFNSALQLIEAACTLDGGIMNVRSRDKIAAWELISLAVSLVNSDGTPAAGTLIVKNVSQGLFPGNNNVNDEREFRFTNSAITIPVYAGHKYDLTVSFDVNGGPAFQYKIAAFPHGKGLKMTYDPYTEPLTETLPENVTNGEIVLAGYSQPQTPYNLCAGILPDVFTLTWDWAAPNTDYQLQYFKVYRNDEEIATVTRQQLDNIPRTLSDDACYLYKVAAVDVNGVRPAFSPTLEVLPEFSQEEQVYFDWKSKYFGSAATLATDDPDQDGLTNWEEFLLGSNPTVAPTTDPKAGLSNIIPGTKVNYYAGYFNSMPVFSTLTPFKSDIITDFQMSTNYDNILSSGRGDSVAVLMTAYFDTEVSGRYRFHMCNNDGARLYIDNNLVIDNGGIARNDTYADIYLKSGVHSFRLEYYEKSGYATLTLKWAGPDFTEKDMNSSVLWYTPDDDSLLAEVIAWQKDSDLDGIGDLEERASNTNVNSGDTDGDGLSDSEEMNIYHTDPNKADTDGDGINDYEEIRIAFTNPLTADFNGGSTTLQTVSGNNYVSASAGWEKESASAYCAARNGSATYNLSIPQRGFYVLELNGGEYNSYATSSEFSIDLYIDNRLCGSQVLKTAGTEPGTLRFFLPELESGTAAAKVVWTNVAGNTYLKINSLVLKEFSGTDNNSNGTADWIENRLANMCAAVIPASSKTSPVCIEGSNSLYLADLSISVTGKPAAATNEDDWQQPWLDTDNNILWLARNTSGEETASYTSTVPQAARGARNTWYADIPLYPGEGVSTISVSLPDEAKSISGNITWTPTDIISDEDMTIRAGDSLLLTASGDATASGSVTVTVNGENFSTDQNGKIPYKFANPGTFTVSAAFTPDNGDPAVNGEIVIKVVAASFAGAPYALVGLDRNWANPQIPAEAVLDYDDSLTVYRVLQADGSSNIAFYGKTAGDAYITARLGDNGPVMAAATISILDIETHK